MEVKVWFMALNVVAFYLMFKILRKTGWNLEAIRLIIFILYGIVANCMAIGLFVFPWMSDAKGNLKNK